ncbi:Serralysin C precursor [Labrenzia sp. THAF82]|uniref:calcium-binding protein n=1 Tax=Labrenzia sp. THAF82 TaxID=2587861 RepID=UPI001267F9F4|nr:hypothetical protein [Labrenzia sp. THAF82]QFT29528.1 Serralysin C precursor [Labrenzia sp. THAF82]
MKSNYFEINASYPTEQSTVATQYPTAEMTYLSDDAANYSRATHTDMPTNFASNAISDYSASFGTMLDNGTVLVSSGQFDVTWSAGSTAEPLVLTGSSGDDTLIGTADDFTIDRTTSSSGSDTLTGSSGDDKLIGGKGDDKLIGGKGDDQMYGGAGSDTFVFKPGFGSDRISDFDMDADRLDFSSMIDANGVYMLTATKQSDQGLELAFSDGSSLMLDSVSATTIGDPNMMFLDDLTF